MNISDLAEDASSSKPCTQKFFHYMSATFWWWNRGLYFG